MTVKLHDNLYIPENFDEKHEYYADSEGKKKYTGVTTILGVLNKPALVGWAARMAVEYVLEHGVIGKTEDTEDLIISEEILEEAKTAYAKKRDDGAKKGTDTHALVEEYVNLCIEQNDGLALPTAIQEHVKIMPFIDWAIKENITFISAETPLVSEKLWVAGTADLIFEKDGKRYIGDIKTYKKIWDRTPMYQCAGYALMYEEMGFKTEPYEVEKLFEEGTEMVTRNHKIHGYCIINLPKERKFDEEQDIKWSFDVEGDTRAFLACVELYKQNKLWKK